MPHAELFVRGARLWTDGALRPDEDALVVAGGRIAARGRSDRLASWIGPDTRVVNAAGRTLTPGLCDAHIHLVQWARSLDEVPLYDCASRAAVLERVGRFVAEHPEREVVVGRGWDSGGWSETPDRASLDRVSAGRPVLLHRKDFHTLWANSAALAHCGIDARTPDPAAGRIVRDAAGEPTGLLLEHAVRSCAPLLAGRDDAREDLRRVREAVRRLHAWGITSVHDFEAAFAQRLLRDVASDERLDLRVLMHLAHDGLEPAIALGLASGTGDDAFRIGAVKLFADGTLGSRTAAMLEPYEGTSESGMELLSGAELRDLVRSAFASGLSVAVHAIGDRAARNVLDAFEASREWIGRLRLPPRIEHLQIVHADDAARLASLGVAASMQPVHATADAAVATRDWGARIARSYPWRTFRDRGVLLAFGSDAPVESPDVAAGLAAAVTRVAPGGAAFVPEQCLGLDEALSAYTEGPARLSSAWPRLGSLRPGSHADLALWSEDLHALPPSRLHAARVVLTVLGGRIVHEADAGAEATPRAQEAGATSPAGRAA